MKNHNETMLGFTSLNDFASTTFGLKYKLNVLYTSIAGALIGLIEKWIYPDPKFVYLLLFLVLCDFGTAVIRAFKTNTFTSKLFPRFLASLTSYCLIISLGWHLSSTQAVFSWLPGFLFGGFYSVLFISIFENLVELGLLPGAVLINLKEKFLAKKKIDDQEKEN